MVTSSSLFSESHTRKALEQVDEVLDANPTASVVVLDKLTALLMTQELTNLREPFRGQCVFWYRGCNVAVLTSPTSPEKPYISVGF